MDNFSWWSFLLGAMLCLGILLMYNSVTNGELTRDQENLIINRLYQCGGPGRAQAMAWFNITAPIWMTICTGPGDQVSKYGWTFRCDANGILVVPDSVLDSAISTQEDF